MKIEILNVKATGRTETWERGLSLLPERERERIRKFRNEPDRVRGVAGALLFRTMAIAACPNEPLKIERNAAGKPILAGKNDVFLNLSHDGDLAVCAVHERPVGIDVEFVEEKNWRQFHRFFTEEEMQRIETAAVPAREFFTLWTIREAFVKADGRGIALLDKDFSVDYEARTIDFEGRRYFFETQPFGEYQLSVCADEPFAMPELQILDEQNLKNIFNLLDKHSFDL